MILISLSELGTLVLQKHLIHLSDAWHLVERRNEKLLTPFLLVHLLQVQYELRTYTNFWLDSDAAYLRECLEKLLHVLLTYSNTSVDYSELDCDIVKLFCH